MQECTSGSELLPADVPALPFCFLSYKPSEQQTRRAWPQGRRVLLLANPYNKCSQGQGMLLICKGVAGAAWCADAFPAGSEVAASPYAWFDGSIWLPQLCAWEGGNYGHFKRRHCRTMTGKREANNLDLPSGQVFLLREPRRPLVHLLYEASSSIHILIKQGVNCKSHCSRACIVCCV